MSTITRAIESIEASKRLDPIAGRISGWVQKATASSVVKSGLSGTWIGHPLHPPLTDLPIGAWTMASLLDITGRGSMEAAAQRLVGVGVLAAVPTAASGAADWSDAYGKEQRVGLVHAVANFAGTALQAASWVARRNGRHRLGAALSLAGLSSTAAGGYLGGYLSFGLGLGVDHTAFEHPTAEWTDVAATTEVSEGQIIRVDAQGTPVALTRRDGQLRALSATCVHAGGPLDEGRIDGDCLVCPWHGSKFRLADGTPVRGPATMKQPTWQTRSTDGRILVRREG
ncbi:hypothetical protein GCM10022261_11970 [Brevibacterium daeguense]|uniref:Rieske domain-containing protein n=1 Tax=Brevibacterium daeguense TaxID=909936 RepID=A0ABP8EIG1_9MICO|nr:Rieske 2Fe-2S domain-containing protein [Brevibacterium daeguense]